MVNSDPSISRNYCCEKCEGLHKCEAWAEGGKRHYKSCEKVEVGSVSGSKGYGKSPAVWAPISFGPYGKGKGKSKDKKGSIKEQFGVSQKIWLGNLPGGLTNDDLKAHFEDLVGLEPKMVSIRGVTGVAAFGSDEEASLAIEALNGSELGGQAIEVDAWTTGK
eukprot:CAMPEP_0180614616 /NCGR_PEP_ID=MMETSP1037_2-20121125/31507_1 /TAXON_ID=632150 /ORGANISM="Azadinium spinosum, Strain 3D9" /LENGTH=162 /DNA_ID=CAMNT_0022634331 /DNA_START=33 /DNA_END=521 /DNA_ORIENTATION=+